MFYKVKDVLTLIPYPSYVAKVIKWRLTWYVNKFVMLWVQDYYYTLWSW